MIFTTPSSTSFAPAAILPSNTSVMAAGNEPSAPTTEASLPETATTDIPEKSSGSGPDDYQKGILSTYDRIGRFDLKKLEVKVLASGFNCLDRHKILTKGQGRLIVVGAHTSHGKSALLMQLAAHVAKTEPVIVHSFEMSSDEIETRLLAAVTSIPTDAILEGGAAAKKVEVAREDFESRRLFVSNIQNRSLNYVMTQVFEFSKIVGQPGLVVIDYGQQVKPGGNSRDTQRVVEITDISAGLLQLAQQLKCNVIVGAQLNNEVLRRAYAAKDQDGNMDYIPIISDIREGSSLAHDASVVLMVVRPSVFDRNKPADLAEFRCVKHRGGALWDEDIKWSGQKCMFYEDTDYEDRTERKASKGPFD